MKAEMYTLRLRGADMPQRQPTSLSPLPSPHLLGFNNGYPSQIPALPVEYFDRRQNPPPLQRSQCIPLPGIGGGSINSLLERTPIPMIVWDISQQPASATLDLRRRSAFGRKFDEPATEGGATSVTIRAPFTPKPIVVHRNGAVVTVGDVLISIYDALRQAAREYGIRPSGHLFSNDSRAGIVSGYSVESLLSSMLANRSQWAGLSPSPSEPEVWVLHIR